MSNIIIRFATAKDSDFIKLIHKESKDEIGSFNLFYSWDNYLANKTTYKFYIVSDDGVDVGFMRFGLSPQLKCYVVKEIGILKQFRGMGYGKKFIQKMPTPIYLTCNQDNLTGNSFYSSIGMKNIGVKKTKTGKLTNVWILK